MSHALLALLLAAALLCPAWPVGRTAASPASAPVGSVESASGSEFSGDAEDALSGSPGWAPPSGARVRELRRQAQTRALMGKQESYTFEVAVAFPARSGAAGATVPGHGH